MTSPRRPLMLPRFPHPDNNGFEHHDDEVFHFAYPLEPCDETDEMRWIGWAHGVVSNVNRIDQHCRLCFGLVLSSINSFSSSIISVHFS